jgi:hypothetical protein
MSLLNPAERGSKVLRNCNIRVEARKYGPARLHRDFEAKRVKR